MLWTRTSCTNILSSLPPNACVPCIVCAQIQIIYQALPPGFYWGTEICYCLLSLTAKLYLGLFLLLNVIMTDGTAEGALDGSEI